MTRLKKGKSRVKKSFILEFDEKKREDYLTGFSKRKKCRQREAEEKKKQILKAEKERIRKEKKNQLLLNSRQITNGFSSIGANDVTSLNFKNHTVIVTELNDINKDADLLAANDFDSLPELGSVEKAKKTKKFNPHMNSRNLVKKKVKRSNRNNNNNNTNNKNHKNKSRRNSRKSFSNRSKVKANKPIAS
ncbi:hypothetical protein HELRODRAFT_182935 [Helobdella robusta]|uniref:Nucleolar protein 12 n=1 Tax=Helobdella robusta TaxID=6412 RepID=T1FIX9_HELRO|nr:hypothetical protein HELRODRAFT_182935 [Helobdella robusta]ESN90029.1 hypothetical protein HELRODRAFT_182935 [Helobdella robusta]